MTFLYQFLEMYFLYNIFFEHMTFVRNLLLQSDLIFSESEMNLSQEAGVMRFSRILLQHKPF